MSEKFIQFSESFKQGFKKFWTHVAVTVVSSTILAFAVWGKNEFQRYEIRQAEKASRDSLFEARVLSFITYEKVDSSDHAEIKDSVRQLRADMNVCFNRIVILEAKDWPHLNPQ